MRNKPPIGPSRPPSRTPPKNGVPRHPPTISADLVMNWHRHMSVDVGALRNATMTPADRFKIIQKMTAVDGKESVHVVEFPLSTPDIAPDDIVTVADLETMVSIALQAEVALKRQEDLPKPPNSYWVEALLPAASGRDFIANLDELFADDWLERYGEARARRMYQIQSAKLIVRHWFGVVVEAFEMAKKFVS